MDKVVATMIVEAFQSENEDMFLIAADRLNDMGLQHESDRFRFGHFSDHDYNLAMRTLYGMELLQVEDLMLQGETENLFSYLLTLPNTVITFIRCWQGFKGNQEMLDLASDPEKREACFGEARRENVRKLLQSKNYRDNGKGENIVVEVILKAEKFGLYREARKWKRLAKVERAWWMVEHRIKKVKHA